MKPSDNKETTVSAEQDDDQVLMSVFEAWRGLRRGAVRKLNKDFYGRWPDALDPAQMDVLETIVSKPSWRMSQLAQALHLDPSTVTRSIDRLTALEYVSRVTAGDDGRGVQVRATAAARKLCKKVPIRRLTVMREILRDLNPDEREELARLLGKMLAGIEAYAATLDSTHDDWTSKRWADT
jgi:DNA-binding MarR family transcriptional regulator